MTPETPDLAPPVPRVPLALRWERARRRTLFRLARLVARHLPFDRVRAAGEAIGELQFRIGFVARRRWVRELAGLLDRPAGDPAVAAHMREAYRTNDAAVLEILKIFDRPQDEALLLSKVEVEGMDRLEAALAVGRGAILLAGHAGNGALFVIRLVAAGLPVSVVYRQARMMDAGFLGTGMARYGIDGILANDGIKAYARMLAALRANRVVYVMADQGTKKARDGLPLRFLGKDMSMPAGPAQLARHSRAPVLPVATVGVRPRWRFEILPPVPLSAGTTVEADAEALLRVSEALILRHPQWWSWHHRRWRFHAPAKDLRAASVLTPR